MKSLRGRGLRVREIACVGAPRTLLCVESGDPGAATVALAAGIHGDEPAGPAALLAMLEDDALDPRFAYRIYPCTNPTGYAAGTRASADAVDLNRTFGRGGQSPEARAIVTANRDRKFALSLDLHEDRDADGFYCFDYTADGLGARIAAAVEAVGLPVQALDGGYDLGFALPAGAASFARGVIRADPVAEAAALGALTYTLALARNAAPRALTLETPSQAPWETRIAMHRMAVTAAIAALSQTSG
ncbi:MAG: M14 family metallocarboxypeptidase [Candidatus Eremiobacteraeota bacterium]|nr:M14 family metallocarboxypeptidase [Candidatus Eremiobacteraeota bacterium]